MRRLATDSQDLTASVRARPAAEAEASASERRYLAAHEMVVALPRNLLPAAVPVLPRAGLAAQDPATRPRPGARRAACWR